MEAEITAALVGGGLALAGVVVTTLTNTAVQGVLLWRQGNAEKKNQRQRELRGLYAEAAVVAVAEFLRVSGHEGVVLQRLNPANSWARMETMGEKRQRLAYRNFMNHLLHEDEREADDPWPEPLATYLQEALDSFQEGLGGESSKGFILLNKEALLEQWCDHHTAETAELEEAVRKKRLSKERRDSTPG